jgi:hypothetical protein
MTSFRWSYRHAFLSSVMRICRLLFVRFCRLEDGELDGAVDDADAERGRPSHEGEGADAGVGPRGERHGGGGGGGGEGLGGLRLGLRERRGERNRVAWRRRKEEEE